MTYRTASRNNPVVCGTNWRTETYTAVVSCEGAPNWPLAQTTGQVTYVRRVFNVDALAHPVRPRP